MIAGARDVLCRFCSATACGRVAVVSESESRATGNGIEGYRWRAGSRRQGTWKRSVGKVTAKLHMEFCSLTSYRGALVIRVGPYLRYVPVSMFAGC